MTAAVIAAFLFSCAAPIPDLRPPPERKTKIPVTDIPVDAVSMLKAHNAIRQQLGVENLKWSVQMQAYATEWAVFLSEEAGCQLRTRGSIGLPLHRNGLGENLFYREAQTGGDNIGQPAAVNESDVVAAWASEAEFYNYTANTCAAGKRCDSYTQAVWSDSVVVGCGAASCGNKDQIWVCNYDPPGNFALQRPY